MEKYANRSGNSPIIYYQINDDSITVWFKSNPKSYTYPLFKVGSFHLSQLKEKAKLGKGLSAYINQNVRDKFI